MKYPPAPRWPLRARLRALVCALIAAATVSAGLVFANSRDTWILAVAVGAVLCLIAWWSIGSGTGTQAPASLLTQPPADFQDTRISSVPRRRHERDEISQAVTVLRRAVQESDDSLTDAAQPAHHDPLTHLADRASLCALSDWLDQNDDGLNQVELCLLCVELKGVEPVKARYGNEAGDHVLTQVAKRLRNVSREEDFLFRLGNDEFMLLVPSPAGEASELARSVGKRVLSDVQRPLPYLTVSNLAIGCNIGAAIWPRDNARLHEVLKLADTALANTNLGRGNFHQYAAGETYAVRA